MRLRDDELVSATTQATIDAAARAHEGLTMEEGRRIRERKQTQSKDQAKKLHSSHHTSL